MGTSDAIVEVTDASFGEEIEQVDGPVSYTHLRAHETDS